MSIAALMWVRGLNPRDWPERDAVDRSKAAHILHCYADYVNEETRRAYPSAATLSRQTGFARNTVTKHIEYLEESGLLRKVGRSGRGQGGANMYEVAYPRNEQPQPKSKARENQKANDDATKQIAARDDLSKPEWQRRGFQDERAFDDWNHEKWLKDEKQRTNQTTDVTQFAR